MKKNKLLTVTIGLSLIVLTIFLLHRLRDNTAMKLLVRFSNAPPVTRNFWQGGINIYFRGYKVGEVSKISLSNDQKHIVFHMNIYYKNLKLPTNSAFILKSEPILGSTYRYFTVSYPVSPSSKLLQDGDVVDGAASFEGLDQFLVTELQPGNIKKLLNNLIFITSSLKSVLKGNNDNMQGILEEVRKSSSTAGDILNDLREIIGDPEVKSELKETIKDSPETIDKVVRNLEQTSENLPKINRSIISTNRSILKTNNSILKTKDTISDTNRSIIETDRILCGTNSLLCSTNCNLGTINSKVPQIPPDLLQNADQALDTLNCIGNETIELLNKRFLLFRLMFGKPASSLTKCLQGNPNCRDKPNQ